MADKGPIFKVILLGEVGVGKTSLFVRLKDNVFRETQKSTIGIDSCSKIVKVDDTEVTLCVWDTAGVERFRTLTQNYYRGSHAAILMYNISELTSLYELAFWNREVDHLSKGLTQRCLKILVGNKSDLQSVVTLEQIKSFADHHNCQHIYHVSAKTGYGVEEACFSISQILLKALKQRDFNELSGEVRLSSQQENPKGCCS